MMIDEAEIPVGKACAGLGMSRSGYYKQVKGISGNPVVRSAIQEIALEFPYYGYRRITKELHRRGQLINHKRVLRIMREDNLLCVRKKFRPTTTDSNHGLPVFPNLAQDIIVTGLNQLWVADITYIQLQNEFVYLAAIIEIFSRKCIGWELGRNIDSVLAMNALMMALSERKPSAKKGFLYLKEKFVENYGFEEFKKIFFKTIEMDRLNYLSKLYKKQEHCGLEGWKALKERIETELGMKIIHDKDSDKIIDVLLVAEEKESVDYGKKC